ncbi:uncharacterized protein LOC120647760 [Panicum virgatum]|uniref:uncharacterized protein LOC120647760 n=1 Tax=Panicum virgatum TaxID=38727 RepID=UPI0019D60A05|nr:uncharacterized protein LOC120647760 [Panicum virgatum]
MAPPDPALLGSEWPPSPYILNVFSSATGRWERRSFSREGEAAGTSADMQVESRWWPDRRSVYWQGALYVHCENNFVMRISVENDTYHVIKPPKGGISTYRELHLGMSKNGVYFASLCDDNNDRLEVWILEESSGELVWMLKHDSGRGLLQASVNCVRRGRGPWNYLYDVNSRQGDDDGANEGQVEHDAFDEWNSDDDGVLNVEDRIEDCDGYIGILGFHPYKEIIFLHRSQSRGLAYHLNSSKLEDLGSLLCTRIYDSIERPFIRSSSPYTPCHL